jgi:phage terminase large subunit-like protein
VFDAWQAMRTMQTLTGNGIHVQEFKYTTQSVGALRHVLYQLIRDHALVIPDDLGLVDELANVKVVTNSAGVERMQRNTTRRSTTAHRRWRSPRIT